jgi:pimeloyl-ACP methyl ester carboxylesterase
MSVGCLPPELGAKMLLRPWRRPLTDTPSQVHREISFKTDGLVLRGWFFPASAPRRGLIVYLHGLSDNRRGAVGLAGRFAPKGYDVLAYDSRAHGQSDGDTCTYGFSEKRDVSAALDAIHAQDAILFGSSLGAAVALQAAPLEPRVRAVIAQSAFSDLATIVAERAPWFATAGEVHDGEELAEQTAHFRLADVSPLADAARIRVPVLLIHGAADRETPPAHSERLYAALNSPKTLVIVPGAGHNDALAKEDTWQTIVQWVDGLPR